MEPLHPLKLINESELLWIRKALQKYVRHRIVDRTFLENLLTVDEPGEEIDPTDPVYGREVLNAFLNALRTRRRKKNNLSSSNDRTVLQIKEVMPEAYLMMQALENANIEYSINFVETMQYEKLR